MHKTLCLISLLGGLAAGSAFAGTYEWTAVFAQGIDEHRVDDGNGNSLNISCSSDEGRYVEAYASIHGQQYASSKDVGFDVIVDGVTYSNPFFTDCHACGANFPDFWAALRKANNLQITAQGQTVKLPTKNLSKVLYPLKSKENSCRSAW